MRGVRAPRCAGRLTPLLLYAAPAWIMLLVHAGASVNQERYNLSLMLGGAIAAAWGIRHGTEVNAIKWEDIPREERSYCGD